MISQRIKILLELNSAGRNSLLSELSKKGISAATLDAMKLVPREYFISEDLYNHAYDDMALPIDDNQTISQPLTVALMTDLLEIKPGDKVLEVGTGSGYQAIILSYLGAVVYSIERIENLQNSAKTAFEDFGINVISFLGDGSAGLPEFAPFERIIVTAGSPHTPLELKEQLDIGGIMVIPVGDKNYQTMTKIIKTGKNKFKVTEHDSFRFVPLICSSAWDI